MRPIDCWPIFCIRQKSDVFISFMLRRQTNTQAELKFLASLFVMQRNALGHFSPTALFMLFSDSNTGGLQLFPHDKLRTSVTLWGMWQNNKV